MDELFEKLKIKPIRKDLYSIAFSHSSYANEHKKKSDYERLEFLGDALLELVMSDYLYRNYREDEGTMSKVRASYVCEKALYRYSEDWGFTKYIKYGNGESQKPDEQAHVAIIADIFESLMGAIYLDLGYEVSKRVILDIITPYVENPDVSFFYDYKSSLQEYAQAEHRVPVYELISEEGPAHDPTFTIQVKIDDIVYGKGVGSSKKDAEQKAAFEALNKLAK